MLKTKKAVGSFSQTAIKNTCLNHNKIIKPFPPYGKKLFDALRHGHKPTNDIFLFVGQNAWQNAKYFSTWQDVLILPPHRHPDEFPLKKCISFHSLS